MFLVFRLFIFCVVNSRLSTTDSLLSHLMKIMHDFWDSSIKRREHTTLWEAGTFSPVIWVDGCSVNLLTAWSDVHLYRYGTVLFFFAVFKWQMCGALVQFYLWPGGSKCSWRCSHWTVNPSCACRSNCCRSMLFHLPHVLYYLKTVSRFMPFSGALKHTLSSKHLIPIISLHRDGFQCLLIVHGLPALQHLLLQWPDKSEEPALTVLCLGVWFAFWQWWTMPFKPFMIIPCRDWWGPRSSCALRIKERSFPET